MSAGPWLFGYVRILWTLLWSGCWILNKRALYLAPAYFFNVILLQHLLDCYSSILFTLKFQSQPAAWQQMGLPCSPVSSTFFSEQTSNQPTATSQQYFSHTTNQHQLSATSETKRLNSCAEDWCTTPQTPFVFYSNEFFFHAQQYPTPLPW
jgi:hypothetical protein